ncbi:DJ-1/PfpI family protein [Lentibacillus halodurans]|uniref:DJ-1/PfpI family protein n=1 Tax=Lentibacillus halodurans TaxID=237679 RepID=A0A1I0X4Y7_9BACI|nr:DJ-1/PfpI family protein [Lentibacillus halodurans]
MTQQLLGSAEKLHTVVHDFVGWETYTEKEGYLIEATASFDEVNPADYDALIIPGGRAPEHIRLNEYVPGIVGHFFEANKPIAAICHAAQILTTVKEHLHGRELTAYIACKPEVEAAGSIYIEESLYTKWQFGIWSCLA